MESLQCPRCNGKWSKVIETRHATIHGFHLIIRIRQCSHPSCGKQYRTKEIVDQELILPSNNDRRTEEGKEAKKQSDKNTQKKIRESKKEIKKPDIPINPFLGEL